MNKLWILASLACLIAQSTAFAGISKTLDADASKKLYSSLKVKIEDNDDIVKKSLLTADSKVKIECEHYVVDKTSECIVTASASSVTFDTTESRKLYMALGVPTDDQDDIRVKSLIVTGFAIKCEKYVVDRTYACSINL